MDFPVTASEDTLKWSCPQPAMTAGKAETANGNVAAPCDREIKVTALVGWAIDAPVENNPVRPGLGRPVIITKRQGMPATILELTFGNGL